MKKFSLTCLLILVGWTCYYDLSQGTLSLITNPAPTSANAKAHTQSKPISSPLPSVKKITVQPGDTVLSIEEKLNGKSQISIAQILKDFKTLNPSVDPNHIQIGQTYLFKLYSEQTKSPAH